MKSGIYVILINKKRYIGSAVHAHNRLKTHKSNLKLNKHPNKHLQRAYNKYWDFDYYIIEYCEKDKLLKREQIWINYFQSSDMNFGYNFRKIPNSNLGLKWSEETRNKMSIASKGHKRNLGVRWSKEDREKHSLLKLGKPNLATRNKDKWPCADGWKCKCNRCTKLRYEEYYSGQARQKSANKTRISLNRTNGVETCL